MLSLSAQRRFAYKVVNTFIDNVYALILELPFEHRIACFIDDLEFVLLLALTAWGYSHGCGNPVDKNPPRALGRCRV